MHLHHAAEFNLLRYVLKALLASLLLFSFLHHLDRSLRRNDEHSLDIGRCTLTYARSCCPATCLGLRYVCAPLFPGMLEICLDASNPKVMKSCDAPRFSGSGWR
ncbi:hypothetical protein GGS23DRAFT_169512 [Durotheca rogersii]|uniref:uncharacterized protein n=1 Tax=Durotheca rogersii TaxID=419775 RepID=UPI002221021B|nr:uncharacterized protein GGS23DRAFT_169512 [Durotheca rogersii]KAI5867299.1 hypothetical protein GGS23DRAFT_169512 [Durotheca rogersii]